MFQNWWFQEPPPALHFFITHVAKCLFKVAGAPRISPLFHSEYNGPESLPNLIHHKATEIFAIFMYDLFRYHNWLSVLIWRLKIFQSFTVLYSLCRMLIWEQFLLLLFFYFWKLFIEHTQLIHSAFILIWSKLKSIQVHRHWVHKMKYKSISNLGNALAQEELDQVSNRELRMNLGSEIHRKFYRQLGCSGI